MGGLRIGQGLLPSETEKGVYLRKVCTMQLARNPAVVHSKFSWGFLEGQEVCTGWICSRCSVGPPTTHAESEELEQEQRGNQVMKG